MKKETYSLYSLIEIRFADPISALGLSSQNVVIGTMMGRICSFSIKDKKSTLINELSQENISGISFDEKNNVFYASVGDDEILKFKIDSLNSNIIPRIKNYKSEYAHSKKCENMFSLISKNSLLLIELAPQEEGNITINKYDAFAQITYFENEEKDNFILPITNYSIPLDYYDDFFVWVEFLSDKKRRLCVKNVNNNNDKVYKLSLDEKFGHISHCKIIPGFKLFLVRDLNKCEIREIDDKFTLVNSFTSIGDEVIAIDFYDKNNVNNEYNHYNVDEKNKNNINKKESILKVKHEKNLPITLSINDNRRESNNIMNENTSFKLQLVLCILDIDGNVSFFENNKITKKFNLYDIKEINKEQKQKQFFSMGYAYYIKFNKYFICITTDHGCYVIKINYK